MVEAETGQERHGRKWTQACRHDGMGVSSFWLHGSVCRTIHDAGGDPRGGWRAGRGGDQYFGDWGDNAHKSLVTA